MAGCIALDDRARLTARGRRVDLTAFSDWLSSTSLALVGGVLLLVFGSALLAGWLIGRKLPHLEDENEPLLTSAVLGLLALLLSFTYALAVDRYEARRLLVQQEANAISTMYLRAQLLDEPHRSRLSRILIDYADNRIALGQAKLGETDALLRKNDRLMRDFWSASAAAFPSIKGLDFSSTFYDSVNLLIDLDATRKSARMARVPPVIFAMLFFYIAVVSTLLGMFATKRGLAEACVFLALLVSFLLVIIDIDQPTQGGIRESQAPMERMRADLPP